MPSFSYLIENMIMFEFGDMMHLLVSFENKSVQLFDLATGSFVHEFEFKENEKPKRKESEASDSENESTVPYWDGWKDAMPYDATNTNNNKEQTQQAAGKNAKLGKGRHRVEKYKSGSTTFSGSENNLNPQGGFSAALSPSKKGRQSEAIPKQKGGRFRDSGHESR